MLDRFNSLENVIKRNKELGESNNKDAEGIKKRMKEQIKEDKLINKVKNQNIPANIKTMLKESIEMNEELLKYATSSKDKQIRKTLKDLRNYEKKESVNNFNQDEENKIGLSYIIAKYILEGDNI